ncbi:MAG: hypothetical protein A2008_10600 [Candidatus Wallbacteria bacterium GWC2_49_35]|uniref:DUF1232 domain-containing protein n=1 Tax=Candidatus Wallbacteria bacterium GWC2_49_35 TaxID=1817813 RepID=A0A1F7WXY9_9BACT|nr:MAG: hypothetical protein A2008_10600 [Candidatus Wallbacteria bacterium GWC2_49_35]HBC74489.1 hypothetical protein [Candidatus Wallbacteria bacterium]
MVMPENSCSGCKTTILSEESIYCHKCGARLKEGAAARGLQKPRTGADEEPKPFVAADSGIFPENNDAPPLAEAGSGPAAKTPGERWDEFSRNYYRLPFSVSVCIVLAALAYAVSPFDFVSGAPLISWVDDALILLCASINLLHCGVEASNHSENVTFKRVKLIVVPITAIVIFFMWFSVNIVLILFQKQ